MEITRDLLRHLLHYDPATGIFTRIAALTPRAQRHVGKRAGTPNKNSGYLEMHAGGRLCLAHRLAWIYCHGAIPNGMRVDHENGLVTDNRIDNLRLATVAQNGQNCKTRVDNTSGIKGVSFDKARDKWAVSVGKKRIGRFDTLFDAACVRKSAAIRTFGEFARES